MRSNSRLISHHAVVFALLVIAFAAAAYAQDCRNLGCHVSAYCDFNTDGDSVCMCSQGTIDVSTNKDGTDCDSNGWSIRYVVDTDPGDNPAAHTSDADGLAMCASGAEGWYVRKVFSYKEVNCLYSAMPDDDDVALYGTATPDGSNVEYMVAPSIYSWRLGTTSQPLQIPPTGMEVQSVYFNTSCAETGCWVVKGVLTTGAAFNTNGAFNTFFLPQADISAIHPQGDISYDFDYSDVEWTFAPANHPCTSAGFQAGVDNTDKISTCCITNVATTPNTGGFVANYRPTQSFSDWAGELRCDKTFERDGQTRCWKRYDELVTPSDASSRCSAAGGKLAVITSEAENDAMLDLLSNTDFGPVFPKVWIGLEYSGLGPKDSPDRTDPTKYSWRQPEDANYTWGLPDKIANRDSYPWPNWIYFDAWDGEWKFIQKRNPQYAQKFVCEFETPSFETPCPKHVIQRPDLAAPEPSERPCWDVYDNDDGKSWWLANATCGEDGGMLATINDAEENWFMHRLLWAEGVSQATYIGVYTPNGTVEALQWADGTPLTFTAWKDGPGGAVDSNAGQPDCAFINDFKGTGPATWKVHEHCGIPRPFVCQYERSDDRQCDSDSLEDLDNVWDIVFPVDARSFMEGKFKDMPVSPGVVNFTNTDPFFGQFEFTIHLDEVELRSKAGKLRGTVGVEHTIDTYLGLANFRTTGLAVLDTFATQTNIHLEKTSFFSVSTHGVNEYTFLEYVNMRLVMILDEDKDFSGQPVADGLGDDESADRTVRTVRDGNAAYIQVTFTMGAQYQPNTQSGGLIPLDSVRAGRGTFFDTVDANGEMVHLCSIYAAANATQDVGLTYDALSGPKGELDRLVGQPCGPQASMCSSPTSVPDQFVSFNIPLGFEVFDDQASSALSNNIFVDFVVNAVDTVARGDEGDSPSSPNDGEAPWQMKTTLSASIPIVDGGINIFCDGVTAKTDLKDVADVDIVVGSAKSSAELSRLRIMQDIASTNLASVASQRIDTASIEAALMTLVIKGTESYFSPTGRNTGDYTMELDDVITLHMMEDGVATAATLGDGSKEGTVLSLLAELGDDNSDSNGLDTDGYALNGAFSFTINRAENTASLEPSAALLAACPFNPPRPTGSNSVESCILRRDVSGRTYRARTGSQTTAMEILSCSRIASGDLSSTPAKDCTETLVSEAAAELDEGSVEAAFLARVLGDSVYTRALAPDFVRAINTRYQLNGRYRRAYWINPGYEWTPTQTAGKSLFQVSQKIYLFALISLDENWTRRRMLLQTSTDPLRDNSAGMNQASFAFEVTPARMMADAFDVPEDRVALFDVGLQLTQAEACMPKAQLADALRSTLIDYLDKAASSYHTVQIMWMEVDLGEEQCANGRRNLRNLLAPFSSASAALQMLIVFKAGTAAEFNEERFASMAGVTSVAQDPRNSPKITITTALACEQRGDCGMASPSDEDKAEDNTAMIAGVAGGVGGAVLLAGGVLVYMRSKRGEVTETAQAVQTINIEDLKSQLANEA